MESAFAAYKNSPSKFFAKPKTPKKHKAKANDRERTPGKADASKDDRSPKKRARTVDLNGVTEIGPTIASSSEYFHIETIANRTLNGKAKVNKFDFNTIWCQFVKSLHIFIRFNIYLEAKDKRKAKSKPC